MDIGNDDGNLPAIHLPREISYVDFITSEQKVDIVIEYASDVGHCLESGTLLRKSNDRQDCTSLHFDAIQFGTYLHCQIQHERRKTHCAKTVTAPWVGKKSHLILLFEAFAICVMKAECCFVEAHKVLGLNWHDVAAIKARAVQCELVRRQKEPVSYLGIDEKQFLSGHHYISSLVDLEQGRVLYVMEEGTVNAYKTLINMTLTQSQKERVAAVSMDMWLAYANIVGEKLQQAAIVHDRFHISKHLIDKDGVAKAWHRENRNLINQSEQRLKGSKYRWLGKPLRHADTFSDTFEMFKNADLIVARSWSIRGRLEPIKQKAKMLKCCLSNLLIYFKDLISNEVSEGLNSNIHTVKVNARGNCSFEGFRNSILFYCGGINMLPRELRQIYE